MSCQSHQLLCEKPQTNQWYFASYVIIFQQCYHGLFLENKSVRIFFFFIKNSMHILYTHIHIIIIFFWWTGPERKAEDLYCWALPGYTSSKENIWIIIIIYFLILCIYSSTYCKKQIHQSNNLKTFFFPCGAIARVPREAMKCFLFKFSLNPWFTLFLKSQVSSS